jgi:hypothetical protein
MSYEYTGNYTEVSNATGQPGYTPPVRLPHDDPAAPGRAGNRRQVMVDAQSGEALDARTAGHLRAYAAHQAERDHYDRQRDTSLTAYMDHVFGVTTGRA